MGISKRFASEEYVDEKVVQPDWNQNEPDGTGYIANRTHYEIASVKTTVLEEYSLTTFSSFASQTFTSSTISGLFSLDENLLYDVVWDETVYENIKPSIIIFDSMRIITVGATCDLTSGEYDFTQYPFCIQCIADDPDVEVCIPKSDGNSTHKLTVISKTEKKIKHLDEKYIPDSVKIHDWSTLENRPFYSEICEEVIFEQNIPSSSFSAQNGIYMAQEVTGGLKTLSKTGTYSVVYDGTLYSNVTVSAFDNLDNYYIIGNIDENDTPIFTTYPFVLLYSNNNFNIASIITNDTEPTSHDLKIIGVVEIIHELDKKYIPYLVGKKVAGQTFTILSENIIAGEGAEIFNDYESNEAVGIMSHAEGSGTTAVGNMSHAEGGATTASSDYSHAEGQFTVADGFRSHAEGFHTKANGDSQHVQGNYNIEDTENKYAHIVGNGTSDTARSNAHTVDWDGNGWYAGQVIGTNLPYSEDPVETTIVEETTFELQDGIGDITATYPLEAGQEHIITLDGTTYNCVAKMHESMGLPYIGNLGLIGTGEDTGELFIIAPMNSETQLGVMVNSDVLEHTISITAVIREVHQLDEKYLPDSFKKSVDEKAGLKVEGTVYTVDGEEVVAKCGAEVFNLYTNIASGEFSHAEGYGTTATGNFSHAEGDNTTASGYWSHSEGRSTIASRDCSHAEGGATTASGEFSHAEGYGTTATGNFSHAEGRRTIASGKDQHVQGRWSIEDTENKYAHIVGNGESSKCSNAHTVDWDGNGWFSGDVYTGSTSGINKDEGSKKLQVESDDTLITTDKTIVGAINELKAEIESLKAQLAT